MSQVGQPLAALEHGKGGGEGEEGVSSLQLPLNSISSITSVSSQGWESRGAKGAVEFLALYWCCTGLPWVLFLLSSCGLFLSYTNSICSPLVSCFGFREIVAVLTAKTRQGDID